MLRYVNYIVINLLSSMLKLIQNSPNIVLDSYKETLKGKEESGPRVG